MSSSTAPAPHTKPYKDGREVEWQLACTDLSPVRRWLSDHGTIDGLTLEPRSTLEIFDTYLDTDDWRIHRAGFALRVRSDGGTTEATLKSLHSASTEVADRRELTEMLNGSDNEAIRQSIGPVGTRVSAVSGARTLLPLFELRTSRQRFAIRKSDEARQLGEIALDETVISRPHGEPEASMLRVEVEAHTESHEPLRSLVKTLRNHCALEAASDTKYSLGLKSVGLAPPAPEFAATTVDASMTIAEVAMANLRRYLAAWQLHEPGARLGDDPEELHDLRVAGRRLDAILRQFQSVLPPVLLSTRATLKTVLRALGCARDLDVALDELQDFSRKLPKSDRVGMEPLKEHLLSERGRARAQMLSVLDSIWVQKNLQEFASLLTAPGAALEASSAGLALRASPGLIRRRFRKLRKRADLLRVDSSTEECHEVRGQVKKLRYVLEAVADLYGESAGDLIRALRRWQENLGLQQDAAVAMRRLNTLAGAKPKDMPAETLFLMGRLAERHLGAARRARKRSATGYRKVRQKWKKLRTTFEESTANEAPAP
ncbi:MAG TPA: CHAD domain-containing protein [Steroidobacteraceae bacterium]|jgi:triphosphatase|nr:CHAD domain-containing protein [Steroidobacteraceae bacterium]